MMQRIWLVANRDFTATVSSKGFLIGLLVMPILIVLFVVVGPRILSSKSPHVVGQIAVIDPTGTVIPELRVALDREAIAARRAKAAARGNGAPQGGQGPAGPDSIPDLTVIERASADSAQADKPWLIQPNNAEERHLALIAIRPDAVERGAGTEEFGSYDLYVSTRLDEATENVIQEGLSQALVSSRLKKGGLDQGAIEATMRVVHPNSVVVAAAGEQPSRRGFARLLPFLCGVLLFVGVITGGQILMTSTVEEKSNRVVEVLLAAVSPVELMWGKLIGQLGVGLLVLGLYLALGFLALFEYSMSGLLDPMLVAYLIVFYLMAYMVYGALMLSIGAAVNQMADAQSLMGPVMVLLVAPYALVPMIGQAPNSVFSVVLSFIPPVNSFVILARLASGTPPPLWQVLGAMLAGAAGGCAAVWFAAKVFKIGLLMHGKPPNFATLVRWARMA